MTVVWLPLLTVQKQSPSLPLCTDNEHCIGKLLIRCHLGHIPTLGATVRTRVCRFSLGVKSGPF